MKRIVIGNDFRVNWTLTQLGNSFNIANKDYTISVLSSYGVIDVANITAQGNVISFDIPAAQQVYLGSYSITLNIRDGITGQAWRLSQCDAFTLVPCGDGDVASVVELSSNIVYPATEIISGGGSNSGEQYLKLSLERNILLIYEEGIEWVSQKPTLNYKIDGELDPNKLYYLRLMRNVSRTTGGSYSERFNPNGRINTNGWVAICYKGANMNPSRPFVRLIDIEKWNTQFPVVGNSNIVRTILDTELQTADILSIFITDVGSYTFFPTGKNKKRRGYDANQIYCYNHLGLAVWEYSDENKPLRQVSNIAKFGITYSPRKITEDDAGEINNYNSWWSIL